MHRTPQFLSPYASFSDVLASRRTYSGGGTTEDDALNELAVARRIEDEPYRKDERLIVALAEICNSKKMEVHLGGLNTNRAG